MNTLRLSAMLCGCTIGILCCASTEKHRAVALPCRSDQRLVLSDAQAAAWIDQRLPLWTEDRKGLVCFVHGPAAADPPAALIALEKTEKTAWRSAIAVFLTRGVGVETSLSNALVTALREADLPAGIVTAYGDPVWEYRRRPLPAEGYCEGMVGASRRLLVDAVLLQAFLADTLGKEKAEPFLGLFRQEND